MPFPELNLKQAWLIPSAVALPNPNGTAPGWFVERPDGRVVVALPGPPREMRPMWSDHVVPRLHGARARGRGRLADLPPRRGSANRRSPSGSARRSCGRPTRSSPPTRGSRRSMSGSRPSRKAAGRPRSSWRTPRPWSSTISATTSGPPARPPGARRSARASASSAGRWRWSRSGPAAASTRCSATSRGSASTNRSRLTHPRPKRTEPTTSRRTRVGLASSAAPMSGSRSGRDRGPGTPPSRSRSSRRAASDASDASSS